MISNKKRASQNGKCPSLSVVSRKVGNQNMILIGILLALFLIASMLEPSTFLNSYTFAGMSYQMAAMGLMSLGMLIAMIAGGIDLSVIGIHNLAGMLVGIYVQSLFPEAPSWGMSIVYILSSVLVAVLVGIITGAINGILISKVGIPAILATMGSSYLYLGICLIVKKGSAVSDMPDLYLRVFNYEIGGVIPVQILILFALAITLACVLKYSQYGLRLYMYGSNPKASKYAGLNNDKIIILTHTISGILCAVGGMLTLARNNSSREDYGSTLCTQAIIICVLGGANPSGGEGNVLGTIVALMILQVFSTGLNMFRDINSFMRDLAWGIVLITVMVSRFYSAKRKTKRQ